MIQYWLHIAVLRTSARTERVDNFGLRKGAAVFGSLEGVSLSLGLRLAWSGGAAEVKRRLTLEAAAGGWSTIAEPWVRGLQNTSAWRIRKNK